MRRDMKLVKAQRRRKRLLLLALLGGGAMAARRFVGETVVPGNGTVTFKDEEPDMLANMLGGLMKEYMKHPGKKAIADRINISVAVEDADNPELSATLAFKGSDVTIADGADPGADIHIRMELSLLLVMAGAPLGLEGLKWLRSEDGRKIMDALKKGRLRIRGVQKHPLQMLRYMQFMLPPKEESGSVSEAQNA